MDISRQKVVPKKPKHQMVKLVGRMRKAIYGFPLLLEAVKHMAADTGMYKERMAKAIAMFIRVAICVPVKENHLCYQHSVFRFRYSPNQ